MRGKRSPGSAASAKYPANKSKGVAVQVVCVEKVPWVVHCQGPEALHRRQLAFWEDNRIQRVAIELVQLRVVVSKVIHCLGRPVVVRPGVHHARTVNVVGAERTQIVRRGPAVAGRLAVVAPSKHRLD